MKDGQAQPDTFTYNLVISTCTSAGKATKAFEVLIVHFPVKTKDNSDGFCV